jgi:hypothetical protein
MASIVQPALITRPLVNGNAKPIITHSNPQTSNPPFPVLLYDQVTVQSGGEQVFRSDAFLNNLNRPIELHGMRVAAIVNTVTNTFDVSGLVALEISLGDVPLTKGAVPIWHLCRSDNRLSELFGASTGAQESIHAWYFSQPLLLLPGKALRVRAKHLGVTPVAATVGVSFAGRVAPKMIPTRVPYAAHWVSRSFAFAEVGTDSAPPSAIVNDTKRDLVIDRIIGRSIAYDNALGAVGEYLDYGDCSMQGVSSFLLRLGLSKSQPILKTYTPWRAVFGQNAAIETDFIMKANDYLTVDVAHIAGPVLPAPGTFSQNRGSVSIVGWREV